MSTKRSWLETTHPAYDEQREEWEINERRMRGGRGVLTELTPFEWEITPGQTQPLSGRDVQPTPQLLTKYVHGALHYTLRQNNAVYLNFPDRYAAIMAGHLIRNSPLPGASLNFGTLGEVRRKQDIDEPTPAELLYYNTDGIGVDGSQWRTYWLHVIKGAVNAGMRWVLAQGPKTAPSSRQDEIDGLRPFLTDYSPLAVKNWDYDRGRLQMAIIHRTVRKLTVDSNGTLSGNTGEKQLLLLTADGFMGFGREFSNGGWYIFDKDHNLVRFGFYEQTDGQIPMAPLYYERLRHTPGSSALCRSGTFELGQAAIAYMNLASSADFDAQDGAASAVALRGVDDAGFNLFVNKAKEGNRYVPLIPHAQNPQLVPEVGDISVGGVAADVFDKRLKAKRQEAEELMLNELEAAPYASGESKKASFADAKEPRLSILAGEVETVQNAMIHFLEQLWGQGIPRPTGSVEWPETFGLERPVQDIKDFFTTAKESGMRSATAEKKAFLMLVRKLGIVGDDESRAEIEQELNESADLVRQLAEAELQSLRRPQPTV